MDSYDQLGGANAKEQARKKLLKMKETLNKMMKETEEIEKESKKLDKREQKLHKGKKAMIISDVANSFSHPSATKVQKMQMARLALRDTHDISGFTMYNPKFHESAVAMMQQNGGAYYQQVLDEDY